MPGYSSLGLHVFERPQPTQTAHRYLQTLRERGVIVQNGDGLKVAQDYTFDSPSTAAGVLLGRSSNGREAWRDEDGRTLKENQTAAVGSPAPAS